MTDRVVDSGRSGEAAVTERAGDVVVGRRSRSVCRECEADERSSQNAERTQALVAGRRAEGELENVRGARVVCVFSSTPPPPTRTHRHGHRHSCSRPRQHRRRRGGGEPRYVCRWRRARVRNPAVVLVRIRAYTGRVCACVCARAVPRCPWRHAAARVYRPPRRRSAVRWRRPPARPATKRDIGDDGRSRAREQHRRRAGAADARRFAKRNRLARCFPRRTLMIYIYYLFIYFVFVLFFYTCVRNRITCGHDQKSRNKKKYILNYFILNFSFHITSITYVFPFCFGILLIASFMGLLNDNTIIILLYYSRIILLWYIHCTNRRETVIKYKKKTYYVTTKTKQYTTQINDKHILILFENIINIV